MNVFLINLDRTTNLLGALALAISDRIETQIKDQFDRSGTSAAALVFLGYIPGLPVEVLRQVLHRSHPGTVRLIDRLEKDGLVKRLKTDDGRAVALHITEKGEEVRSCLLKSRSHTLEGALENLTAEERVTFGTLMAKVLSNLPDTEVEKHHICRLCAVDLCTDCPIPGHASMLEPYRNDTSHG
ncbi:MAG: MarR family transcriptional regulator [Bacteroidota bacterium]